MSSSCGCSSGSPPLIVMTDVPRSPSRSTRRSIWSVETGFEKSSYSLQYVHDKLQHRIGIKCASRGWSVDARAFRICHNPCAFRSAALNLRRHATDLDVTGLDVTGLGASGVFVIVDIVSISPQSPIQCTISRSILPKHKVKRRLPASAKQPASCAITSCEISRGPLIKSNQEPL